MFCFLLLHLPYLVCQWRASSGGNLSLILEQDSKWRDAVPNSQSSKLHSISVHSFIFFAISFGSLVCFSDLHPFHRLVLYFLACSSISVRFSCVSVINYVFISCSMVVYKEIALLLSLDHHFGSL